MQEEYHKYQNRVSKKHTKSHSIVTVLQCKYQNRVIKNISDHQGSKWTGTHRNAVLVRQMQRYQRSVSSRLIIWA